MRTEPLIRLQWQQGLASALQSRTIAKGAGGAGPVTDGMSIFRTWKHAADLLTYIQDVAARPKHGQALTRVDDGLVNERASQQLCG